MPNYRRLYRDGGTYFFTVKTYKHQRFLCEPFSRTALRNAIQAVRTQKPFEIVSWVLLPDHLHAIWTMPKEDNNFSVRWSMIKRRFTQQWLTHQSSNALHTERMHQKREACVWQMRFWEHLIRDRTDMANHMDYIHYNPIKHSLVKCPHDWPYSTFHRWIKAGAYRSDWLCSCNSTQNIKPNFLDAMKNTGE